MILYNKFKNKKILITGHTGFKGSWLAYCLFLFGAKVYGISKNTLGDKSLYKILNLKKKINSIFIDINNYERFESAVIKIKPDIIFHLAAESIVSRAYEFPLDTFKTNIIGTANLLNIIKKFRHHCACIFITSDKCYENIETKRSYVEKDRLGGSDPYSSSKACAEIIISSMYRSYLSNNTKVQIGVCRAGNVIGGGDWSVNRLIPDVVRSIESKDVIKIRNPQSTRPWQHVLDPLNGYIILAYKLYFKNFNSGLAFNFGPDPKNKHSVRFVLDTINKIHKINYKTTKSNKIKEANLLSLNSRKARKLLSWNCKYNTKIAIKKTIDWYLTYLSFPNKIENFTRLQINDFFLINE